MAVYERTYRPYRGALTPEWSRFLVLPRYVYRDIFQKKLFVGFLEKELDHFGIFQVVRLLFQVNVGQLLFSCAVSFLRRVCHFCDACFHVSQGGRNCFTGKDFLKSINEPMGLIGHAFIIEVPVQVVEGIMGEVTGPAEKVYIAGDNLQGT